MYWSPAFPMGRVESWMQGVGVSGAKCLGEGRVVNIEPMVDPGGGGLVEQNA